MAFLAPVGSAFGLGIALVWRRVSGEARADRLFEQALEGLPSGMMLVEADGTISFANSEARRMFASEELAGLTVEALMPESAAAHHGRLRRRYFAAAERRSMGKGRDLLARARDGREFPVEIGLSPIRRGRRTAILAAVVDISARKQTEAALLRSNAELEQFAYLASHDMQEPLRMVASYTQLLAEKYHGRLDDRADRYIQHASEGAQRMQTLVRDLLAYSRLTATPRPSTRIDMTSLAVETTEHLRHDIEALGGDVTVSNLPHVLGDKSQLARVIQNLVSNALKFRGEAVPHIRISGERRGVLAVIYVEDNGIGIDPRHFERAFLMFQRLHERGKYEGSGIGLAIVKKIVESHGGSVWIQSALGEGAKIGFTLAAAGMSDAADALVACGR